MQYIFTHARGMYSYF